MNNPFVIRQAEAAGQRVRSSCNDAAGRVKTAYVRFLSRYPTATETAQAREFLARFPAPKNGGDRDQAAWTAFCQALYATAEFRYID